MAARRRRRKERTMKILWRLVLNAAALWIAAELISGVDFDGGWLDLLILAVVFGLVNAFVRPVARLLTFPITIATLGLFTFVINAFMLMLTAAISDSLAITGGLGEQFVTALLAAVVISVVSVLLSWVLPDRR
jgi:putative membrane protein